MAPGLDWVLPFDPFDCVKREEARQNFIAAAESSFEHYKETGLHISLDEFSTWVDDVQEGSGVRVPACHT